jgi:MFS transporter, DHA2 family, multidrug resistance protein
LSLQILNAIFNKAPNNNKKLPEFLWYQKVRPMKLFDYFKNPPKISPYTATLILTLSTFMEMLDTTIAHVALPKIASGFGVSLDEAGWSTGAYLIANATIVPISAWLATYFGRKRYFMTCIVLFTLSSLLCAFSQNIEMLIFFRVLQGLSGGGLASSEQSIISDITPPNQLGRVFAVYTFAATLGPICGPTVGGFISDNLGWQWVFLINIPIGIVSFILTGIFIRESSNAKERTKNYKKEGTRVDFIGIFSFICGIACLELFLHEGPKENWFESRYITVLGIIAALSLIIGITWEYYQRKPAIDIFLFKYRHFTVISLLIFFASFISTGAVFLFPFMAQSLYGYSAINSGLIFLPGTLVMMASIQIMGVLTDKIDVRWILLAGFIVLAFSQWNLSHITYQTDYSFLVWARVFQSFGLSFGGVSLMASAYMGMPEKTKDSISAFTNLARNSGSSLGIAVASTFIIVQTQTNTKNLGVYVSDFNPNFTDAVKTAAQHFHFLGYTTVEASGLANNLILNALEKQAGMLAFIDAFKLYMVLYLLMIPLVFLLKKKSPED